MNLNPLIQEIEIFDDFHPNLSPDDEKEQMQFMKKIEKFSFKPGN